MKIIYIFTFQYASLIFLNIFSYAKYLTLNMKGNNYFSADYINSILDQIDSNDSNASRIMESMQYDCVQSDKRIQTE